MSKGSDINVSSIEEDIKILQELMEDVELTFAGWVDILNEREKKALKNLIQDYTRQKQINEEHQKLNGELREKVKELEEENSTLKNFTSSIFNNNIEKDFIVKQKIKDKIDELKETLKHYNEYSKLNLLEKVNVDLIDARIDILQELLQESEDK